MSSAHHDQDNCSSSIKKETSPCDSCDLLKQELANAKKAQSRADEIITNLIVTNQNLAGAIKDTSSLLARAHLVAPHSSPSSSSITTTALNTNKPLTVAQIIAPWNIVGTTVKVEPLPRMVLPHSKPGYQCILCGTFYYSHTTTRHYKAKHGNYLGGQLGRHHQYPNAFHFKTNTMKTVCPSRLRPRKEQIRGVQGVNMEWLDYPEDSTESESSPDDID